MSVGGNVLWKVLIALVSGALGYLLTTFTRQPVIWSLTMSIFIGGVSLVVQFLVEVDKRVSHLDRRFDMVNEATELFGRVEAGGLRTETAVDLVKTAAQVAHLGSPLLTRFADDLLSRQSDILRQLVHQRVADHPGDDLDWLLILTAHAEESIKATTTIGRLSVDDTFWASQTAETYLQLQRAAVERRHVKVRRLFIVGSGWRENDEVRKIVRRNAAALIEVRILDRRPTSGLFEFIVFDDQICQEFPQRQTVSGEPELSPTTQLRLQSKSVRRRVDEFDDWWSTAIEVEQEWLRLP